MSDIDIICVLLLLKKQVADQKAAQDKKKLNGQATISAD